MVHKILLESLVDWKNASDRNQPEKIITWIFCWELSEWIDRSIERFFCQTQSVKIWRRGTDGGKMGSKIHRRPTWPKCTQQLQFYNCRLYFTQQCESSSKWRRVGATIFGYSRSPCAGQTSLSRIKCRPVLCRTVRTERQKPEEEYGLPKRALELLWLRRRKYNPSWSSGDLEAQAALAAWFHKPSVRFIILYHSPCLEDGIGRKYRRVHSGHRVPIPPYIFHRQHLLSWIWNNGSYVYYSIFLRHILLESTPFFLLSRPQWCTNSISSFSWWGCVNYFCVFS